MSDKVACIISVSLALLAYATLDPSAPGIPTSQSAEVRNERLYQDKDRFRNAIETMRLIEGDPWGVYGDGADDPFLAASEAEYLERYGEQP